MTQQAATIAKDVYGVSGVVKELPSERDQNFLLTADTGATVCSEDCKLA